MGRQITIVTTWKDELAILRKIAELADSDLRIFRRGSVESPEAFWINNWEVNGIGEPSYGIWPRSFVWAPRYRQIKPPCAPQMQDKWVFANEGVAPVIELSRHLHGHGSAGRLYWSKYFVATEPLEYDIAAFDQLVSALWRWVRKTGHATGSGAYREFIMPDAFRQTVR